MVWFSHLHYQKEKKRSMRETGQGGGKVKKVRKKDKKIPHKTPESVSLAFRIIKVPLK